MSNNKVAGYIILWQIPDVAIVYEDAQQIAHDAGLAEKYAPQTPKKRSAWERATNLGKSGKKVDPPQWKAEQVERQYGVKPVVKLHTQIISGSAPQLVRHIVRTVTIPHTDPSLDKRKLAQRQLDQQTVAIMEFDTETNMMKSTGYNELHDESGWVNGNLKSVVQELMDEVDHKVNFADGDKVRDGVRAFLYDHGATLMSSGGAYFIPHNQQNKNDLQALKVYVEALNDYRRDQSKRMQLTVFAVTKDGDAFDTRLDVAMSAVDAFKEAIQEIVSELQPVIEGEKTQTVASNIKARCTKQFMEISRNVALYREALDDNLSALDTYLEAATETITAAQTSKEYKLTKAEREASQKAASE